MTNKPLVKKMVMEKNKPVVIKKSIKVMKKPM